MRYLLALSLVACHHTTFEEAGKPAGAPVVPLAPAPKSSPPSVLEAEILSIATSYKRWGRVDEKPNPAAILCTQPTPRGVASHVRFGDASSGTLHGERQLYYLYAKDKYGYLSLGEQEAIRSDFSLNKVSARDTIAEEESLSAEGQILVGHNRTPRFDGSPVFFMTAGGEIIDEEGLEQVIVKEYWIPKVVEPRSSPASLPEPPRGETPPPVQWVTAPDGTTLEVDAPSELFVMMKFAPGTVGTDQDWLYATVSPDRSTVTSVGRLERCMGCHHKAPHGRLFGLAPLD